MILEKDVQVKTFTRDGGPNHISSNYLHFAHLGTHGHTEGDGRVRAISAV